MFKTDHQNVLQFEFSRNTQSWQDWYFCTNFHGNKLEIVASRINFRSKLHWSWCSELKLKVLIIISFLSFQQSKNAFFSFQQSKNANIANFVLREN